jgi:hypothetical protein
MMEIATDSKVVPSAKAGSIGSGLEPAHKAKECNVVKEAGRQSTSAMEKMSQNKWNLWRPEP